MIINRNSPVAFKFDGEKQFGPPAPIGNGVVGIVGYSPYIGSVADVDDWCGDGDCVGDVFLVDTAAIEAVTAAGDALGSMPAGTLFDGCRVCGDVE